MLHLIRFVVIAVTFVCYCLPCIPSNYRWACRWLFHYCWGSGKNQTIPTDLIRDLLPSLIYLEEDGVVKFHSSTLYEGYGFEERPALFYMIGGFTANISKGDKFFQVSLEDVYDWHSTSVDTGNTKSVSTLVSYEMLEKTYSWEDLLEWDLLSYKERRNLSLNANLEYIQYTQEVLSTEKVLEQYWHCSSIPMNLPDWVHCVLNWAIPKYYVLDGWPMGNKGITNQLWSDLQLVGAKPFKSVFNGKLRVY